MSNVTQQDDDPTSIKERILLARAKLHPSTQILLTVFDFILNLLGVAIVFAAASAFLMWVVYPQILEAAVRSFFLR